MIAIYYVCKKTCVSVIIFFLSVQSGECQYSDVTSYSEKKSADKAQTTKDPKSELTLVCVWHGLLKVRTLYVATTHVHVCILLYI